VVWLCGGCAGRGVEGEAPVGVLGQAIDLAVAALRHREMLGREELGAGGERDQHRLEGVERRAGHAPLRRDAADLSESLLDRLRALLHQRHAFLLPPAVALC